MKIVWSMCVSVILFGTFHSSCSAWGQETPQSTSAAAKPNQFITDVRVIKQVDPAYPQESRLRAVQGLVVLTATIATDGTVKDIKAVSGDLLLRKAAMEAISQSRYEPYRVEGVATEVSRTIQVNFTMGLGGNQYNAGQAPNGSNVVNSGATQTQMLPLTGAAAATPVVMPPAPAGVIRVSGQVMAGQLDKRVEPVYPADSIAVDARGDVLLLATITKTGEVGDVQAVSGPYRFRDAAVAAVKQWRYRPYVVDGAPVDVQIRITLNFAPPKSAAH